MGITFLDNGDLFKPLERSPRCDVFSVSGVRLAPHRMKTPWQTMPTVGLPPYLAPTSGKEDNSILRRKPQEIFDVQGLFGTPRKMQANPSPVLFQ